ncbi:hypothetical protein, conserved [Trypanosoma brucei gambiense DAL972]|uniref:Uncharacterized protein n=2 Tax=Trypanosoma brucei TaxID=5691 RepID=D0A9P7_TRYB9|nr:hypothetical protein, conserved [Trypanosoma brucei gambiense DAL972]RHW68208.1 hypothetical protein DPX39_110113800 [Trypanosoma brucei equiperdum]CBH18398.1 hypothetical protein, conserved [Trypanosoma brucei gambiense DAL972]|eukprot:XP_011780662.1 hypothetical protein, conserved [Trypanosoma brucei gambiense DAL972]
MMKNTVRRFVKEITYLEVWEHFRRFGDAAGPDSVKCRLLCSDAVATQLNERIRMRYLLEQFLAQSSTTTSTGVAGEPRRWWEGDLTRCVDSDRRVLAETLLEDGWMLMQLNNCVSDREWLITTMTFQREKGTT